MVASVSVSHYEPHLVDSVGHVLLIKAMFSCLIFSLVVQNLLSTLRKDYFIFLPHEVV